MAKRDPAPPDRFSPPDLEGLAHRQLIDPADMPTQGFREDWPLETAEVELLPSTSDVELPAVQPLGPPVARARQPIPILSPAHARAERRRSSKWVGNLVLVSIGFGLLGGIAFAASAVWYVKPTGTERWFDGTTEWLSGLAAPAAPVQEDPASLALPPPPGPEPEPIEAEPRLEEALLGDEVAFEEVEDEAVVNPPEEEPPPVEEPVVEPEPAPVRRARRSVPRPRPTAGGAEQPSVPLPKPTVKPYSERPRPQPEPPPEVDENGLLIRR
ncbi:MAG: hypothetical protein AAF211_02075 [Myxococcota bacterium]